MPRPAISAMIILDTPNPKAADEIARALKIDPKKFADSLPLTVGQTGAAHAGLMLDRCAAQREGRRQDPGRDGG